MSRNHIARLGSTLGAAEAGGGQPMSPPVWERRDRAEGFGITTGGIRRVDSAHPPVRNR